MAAHADAIMRPMARQGRNASRDRGDDRKGAPPAANTAEQRRTDKAPPPGRPAEAARPAERLVKQEEAPLPPLSDSEARALAADAPMATASIAPARKPESPPKG